MKTLILLGLVMAGSAQAAIRAECTSADRKDKMVLTIEKGMWTAGFAMNGMANMGEEVRIRQRYLSRNGLAATISVEGKREKMEVVVTSTGMSPGLMKGKMFNGKVAKNAVCMVQESKQ